MASLRLGAPALAQSSSSGIFGSPCKLSFRGTSGGKNHAQGAVGFSGGMHRRLEQRRTGRVKAQQQQAEEGNGGDDEDDDDFDARLAKLQKKVTSGSGKKAEARKARKEGGDSVSSNSGPKDSLFIAPVPLNEPFSDGVPVQLGINSYTERLHGRLAALGLAAVLLVELATGDSFIKYHDTGTLTLQGMRHDHKTLQKMLRVVLDEKFE